MARKRRPNRKDERRTQNGRERNFDRDEMRSENEKAKGSPRSARNDVSWYAKYPNLLQAAGSFPYPYRPGMDLTLGSVLTQDSAGTTTTQVSRFPIPGVMALKWAPSVGRSSVATDPISVAAKEIYAKVRSAYSGSLEADAPDFIMYLMALDSVYSYIAWLKRLYRVMTAWTPENYALPDVVLSAMGLFDKDIEELRQDRTHLWQIINELVLQSRKFSCPALMDVFNRHYWMNDNVYSDAATLNSQLYLFTQEYYYQFSMVTAGDGSSNTVPGLIMVQRPYGTGGGSSYQPITVKQLYEFGEQLINALVEWDDAYTINGYLQRAYQGVPNFFVEELAADAVLVPVYEEEVLMQIENSRAVGVVPNAAGLSGLTVTQNPLTNAVISDPTITTASVTDKYNQWDSKAYTRAPTISIRSETPTVADSVVASRLQTLVTSLTKTSSSFSAKVAAGTEIALLWQLFVGVRTLSSTSYTFTNVPDCVVNDGKHNMADINFLALEQFDWHPFIWVTSNNGYTYVTQPLGDVHNITAVSEESMLNLHKICLFSEFNAFSF